MSREDRRKGGKISRVWKSIGQRTGSRKKRLKLDKSPTTGEGGKNGVSAKSGVQVSKGRSELLIGGGRGGVTGKRTFCKQKKLRLDTQQRRGLSKRIWCLRGNNRARRGGQNFKDLRTDDFALGTRTKLVSYGPGRGKEAGSEIEGGCPLGGTQGPGLKSTTGPNGESRIERKKLKKYPTKTLEPLTRTVKKATARGRKY